MKDHWSICKIVSLLLILGLMLSSSPSQASLTKNELQRDSVPTHSPNFSSPNNPKTSISSSSIKFCYSVKGSGSYSEQEGAIFSANTRLFIYIEIYDILRHQLTITIKVTSPNGSLYIDEIIEESRRSYDYAKWWEKKIDSYDWNGEYRTQIQVTDKTTNQSLIETGSFYIRDAAPLITLTMEDLPVHMGVGTYHRVKVNLYNLDPSLCGYSTVTVRLIGSAFNFPDGNSKSITLGPSERQEIYFTLVPTKFGINTLRVEILFLDHIILHEDYSVSITIGYLYALPIAAILGLIVYLFKRSKLRIRIPWTKHRVSSLPIEPKEIVIEKINKKVKELEKEIKELEKDEKVIEPEEKESEEIEPKKK